MKQFLLKSGLFLLGIGIAVYFIFGRADGKTDPFYLRFTSPKQHSLVIGTSRAAQGLQPKSLGEVLKGTQFFNYAFTVGHSPYGPAYLSSIKRKLDQNTKDGIFIVTVDPWSISAGIKHPDDVSFFPENKRLVGNSYFVNMNPNIPYLIENYDKKNYNLLLEKKTSMVLQKDGWLEVSANGVMKRMKSRMEKKLKEYNEKTTKVAFSQTRLDYLLETIQYLKDYGEVYLVRLPVHERMIDLENEFMPAFESKMLVISEETKTPYYNMLPQSDQYIYVDGHHIYKESGKEVSKKVAEWIKEQQN